jgi:hypothetical protein
VPHGTAIALESASHGAGIEKLVIDGGFRDAFFIAPAVASEAAGIPLTDRERSALARIRPSALAAFPRYLDAKRVGGCGRTLAQGVEDPPDDQ